MSNFDYHKFYINGLNGKLKVAKNMIDRITNEELNKITRSDTIKKLNPDFYSLVLTEERKRKLQMLNDKGN